MLGRKDIGAIGAKIYYKNKKICHAGVAINDLPVNMFENTKNNAPVYFGRDNTTRNVLAITGKCLFSRRKIYEEVGYMDEENFEKSFSDIDFCLKIVEKGYLIVYNPYIELIYEKNKETKEIYEKEENNFKNKWKQLIEKGDPYLNINFSKKSASCEIKTDKRTIQG